LRHALVVSGYLVLSAFAWEGRVAHLGEALESDDVAVRLHAARRIGELNPPEAVSVVLRALRDEALEVREAAADSAARLRAKAAIPILASWLTSSEERERAVAVRSIARIDDPAGTPALVRALLDPSAMVRIAVLDGVDARGELVAPVATCLDDVDSGVRAAAARSLGRGSDGRALFSIVAKLSDEVPLVRLALVRALTDLGDPEAAPSLLALVTDAEPEVRSAAVYAIGRLGGAAQRDALLHVLDTGTIDTQRAALLALGEIGDVESAPALARHVRHESLRAPAREGLIRLSRTEPARLAAARAVLAEAAQASSPRELEDLGVALNDATRDGSIEALGPDLVRALEDSPLPRAALLTSLGQSASESALLPLLLHLEKGASERKTALIALEAHFMRRGPDGRALEPILDVLDALDGEDEGRALTLLALIGEPRATGSVIARLASTTGATRLAAARALGAFDDARAETALLGLLDDARAEIRDAAALGLGRRSRPTLIPELITRLDRRTPTDRASILLALGGLFARGALGAVPADERSRALTALEDRIAASDQTLASAAIDALARDSTNASEPALVRASGHVDVALRAQAQRALGSVRSPTRMLAVRALLLREREPLARAALFSSLAVQGTEADVEPVLDAVKRERGRVAQAASYAVHELARRGLVSPKHAEAICQLAHSRDAVVRANVLLAGSRAGIFCPRAEPRKLLEHAQSDVVRAAAAHAMLRRSEPEDRSALARCAVSERARAVAEACAGPVHDDERDEVDVVVFDSLGAAPLPKRPVALLFADGSVLVTLTDPRGRLRLAGAAKGSLSLASPSYLRLEP
jgi:HEAT repeat protein